MGKFFAPAPPKAAPPPPPPPPVQDDKAVQDAAAQERNRRAKAQGRASTMLTETGEEEGQAITAKKRLLGS